jgi:8-oxo-dGTP pyrophosphatase MutT (NUDIX family)
LRREVQEEAGLRVEVGGLVLDAPLEVVPGTFVRIVAFRCRVVGEAVIAGSDEHRAVRFVPDAELATLRLPSVYRRAIVAEAKMLG